MSQKHRHGRKILICKSFRWRHWCIIWRRHQMVNSHSILWRHLTKMTFEEHHSLSSIAKVPWITYDIDFFFSKKKFRYFNINPITISSTLKSKKQTEDQNLEHSCLLYYYSKTNCHCSQKYPNSIKWIKTCFFPLGTWMNNQFVHMVEFKNFKW